MDKFDIKKILLDKEFDLCRCKDKKKEALIRKKILKLRKCLV